MNGRHIQSFISPGKHSCRRMRQLFNVHYTFIKNTFLLCLLEKAHLSWSILRSQNQTMPICKPWYKIGADVQAAYVEGVWRVGAGKFAWDSSPCPLIPAAPGSWSSRKQTRFVFQHRQSQSPVRNLLNGLWQVTVTSKVTSQTKNMGHFEVGTGVPWQHKTHTKIKWTSLRKAPVAIVLTNWIDLSDNCEHD